MIIGSLQGVGPASEVQLADASGRAKPAQETPPEQRLEGSLQAATGKRPKQEIPATQSAPSSSAIREDEVQLQRDTESGGQIVVRYLDKTGSVILQIPSSQMLALSRAVHEEFQEQAKAQESARSAPAEKLRHA